MSLTWEQLKAWLDENGVRVAVWDWEGLTAPFTLTLTRDIGEQSQRTTVPVEQVDGLEPRTPTSPGTFSPSQVADMASGLGIDDVTLSQVVGESQMPLVDGYRMLLEDASLENDNNAVLLETDVLERLEIDLASIDAIAEENPISEALEYDWTQTLDESEVNGLIDELGKELSLTERIAREAIAQESGH